ncbi:MAG: DoxX family protein, partial [Anaerolineales bacterium]|nr:DoxX family protein [Anaerolineales bacterium]
IGLILPWLTGILPWLTPLAAVGLAIIMLGATNARLKRGETQFAIGTVVFFLMCAFVAYGRYFL